MPKVTCMSSTAYNRTIATIRDYPRMVYELEQLKRDAGTVRATSIDGMPKAGTGSGLDDKIALIVDLERDIERMQQCIDTIPADLRDGVMNNILYNTAYPRNEYGHTVPDIRTWKRAKREFVVLFAKTMRFIR